MLPEISRRCRSCGAAVRAGARFCPQCGAVMVDEPAAATSAAPERREVEPPAAPAPAPEVTQTREWTPPTREFAAFARSLDGARQGAGEPPADSAARPQPEPAAGPQVEPAAGSPAEPSGVPPPHAAVETPRVAVEAPRAEGTPAVAGAEAEARLDGDAAAGASDARGRVARVRDGTRARVERMRDEAIVVLEETPDDSGLRFVVAAAALFVVFVVLLFLSTTVLR
ncbi:MAG: zinc-ribbon domain-containing protein [Pyrinomonadaceae bacterium]